MTPDRRDRSHARPTAPEQRLTSAILRDPETAAGAHYDLIVVGGGIQGVAVLLEAARRGLKALLLERADYGGATSWANLRIVHGGLRHLQSLNMRRFRESVGERRWFLDHFPDLVRPLACLMPLYARGLRRPAVFRVALALNDLLSARHGVGTARLPRGRYIDAVETIRLFPQVDRAGLRGGALWYDAVMLSPERMVMEMLHWACACGGRALNYVAAQRLMLDGAKLCGIEAYDRVGGRTHRFAAARVVNAAGPWSRALAARLDRDLPELFRPSLAFNLLLERAPIARVAMAIAPKAPGARTYFVLPWKGRILAGTYHTTSEPQPVDAMPSEVQVAKFLGDLNAAVPGLGLAPEAVLQVYAGFLPSRGRGPEPATRDIVHDHGTAGGPQGLYSVSGVKFTTARVLAEKTLRVIFRDQGIKPTAEGGRRPPPLLDLSGESLEQASAPLAGPPDLLAARLRALIAQESVVTLEDLLFRRLDSTASVADVEAARRQAARLLGGEIEAEVNCSAEFLPLERLRGDPEETESPPS